MSSRESGGAVTKRQRRQLEEEEVTEPAALETTACPQVPLPLLCVVMWLHGMLDWLQLCNPQGVAQFSFVRLPPRVHRPIAGTPVYDMSLTHAERLHVVGCGFKGRLVRLLSLGVGHHFEPQRNRGACRKMMQSNVRRVASKLGAAVLERVVKEAERLLVAGQYAAAAAQLQRAIDLGHLPSRAHLADLFLNNREGFAKVRGRAFALVEEGARFGCHHCQGVLADCYWVGTECRFDAARSLALARASAGNGSKYGQFVLGHLYNFGSGGVTQDYAAAFEQFRLAAAQGYDVAQFRLGYFYQHGWGGVDSAKALQWFKLAAAQGFGAALYNVGEYYEKGLSVAADRAEAIRWYKRAAAAGHPIAAGALNRLGVTCTQ